METTLLNVRDLHVEYHTDDATVYAVNGVSFDVKTGETLGLIGETGAGKTSIALSILRLLPEKIGKITSGKIILNGVDITEASENAMCDIRGETVSMIFQEPMKALDPVFTIGNQMEETVRRHNKGVKKAEARARCLEMLKKVEIANPEHVLKCYPHELSGGMKQRIIIAMALICEPMLLIADEPTTALDVTIQAQILELMQNIRKITNASIIFITHDLGVIANLCDRVLVMYAGQVVEAADKKTLFLSPKHPYTRGLLGSLPRLDEDRETLDSIPGSIPLPKDFPAGCRFSTRCEHASEQCAASEPGCYMCGGSLVKCWRYAENKTEKENEQ